MALSRRAVE